MTKSKIEQLKEITAMQCSDGNWNYDPYMHGMANGMIMALSMMEGKEPEFLDAPDEWLSGTVSLPQEPTDKMLAILMDSDKWKDPTPGKNIQYMDPADAYREIANALR